MRNDDLHAPFKHLYAEFAGQKGVVHSVQSISGDLSRYVRAAHEGTSFAMSDAKVKCEVCALNKRNKPHKLLCTSRHKDRNGVGNFCEKFKRKYKDVADARALQQSALP